VAHLADTNVFLEILLGDSKAGICSSFISKHHSDLYITDFSINSIGIVTSRLGKIEQFEIFLRDILPHVHIARLAEFSYDELVEVIKGKGLDFDDAYQLVASKEYNLTLVTLDKDFRKVEKEYSVVFL
jgi:predicted nucleic acid-binding protein